MKELIYVFVGGGAGSLARYGFTRAVARYLPTALFPWPTLGVNILGAFIIGLLVELLALRTSMTAPMRFLLVTGFLGGFTTFSAFSLESALMLERGDIRLLIVYVVASVIGTVGAVFAGMGLVRSWL